jgi:hypothetical protein
VVVLQPGEPHTGGPLDQSGFVYRVMYPAADLLREASGRVPRFPEPVVTDPTLAEGHAGCMPPSGGRLPACHSDAALQPALRRR